MESKKGNMVLTRLSLAVAMLTWGSLGLVTRKIDLSAFELSFFRAFFALPILFIMYKVKNKKENSKNISYKIIFPYLLSGFLIAVVWSTLFLGYKYTSISTAVLIYNMCPVYVMIMSPIFLKEKLDKISVVTIVGSFIGLCLLIGGDISVASGVKGMIFAFISGIAYSIVVILNRKFGTSEELKNLDITFTTFLQLSGVVITLLPYQIYNKSFSNLINLSFIEIVSVIVLGVIFTGLAYLVYFNAYNKLQALEVVSYSYLEPLFGIMLGIFFFGESMGVLKIIGGSLIFGLTFFKEIYRNKL